VSSLYRLFFAINHSQKFFYFIDHVKVIDRSINNFDVVYTGLSKKNYCDRGPRQYNPKI